MGGGDLNSKKSWHPNTMKNQERVWKAEQAAAQEKKRTMELQREHADERDRTELNNLAKRNAGTTDDNRLHWMYDKPDKKAHHEDYLLGKSIDKNYDQPDKSEDNVIPAVARRVVGSSMQTTAGDSQVDLARKIREDPLLLVKERERAARAALLNNPLQRRRLAELLRKEQDERKESKAKKKPKKEELDNVLAAKLNALGGDKGIDLAALLASDSSSSESSEDKKPKKKKKKQKHEKSKKYKKLKEKKNTYKSESDTEASECDKRKKHKSKDKKNNSSKDKKNSDSEASSTNQRYKSSKKARNKSPSPHISDYSKTESRKRKNDSDDFDIEANRKKSRSEIERKQVNESMESLRRDQDRRRISPQRSRKNQPEEHWRAKKTGGLSEQERAAKLAAMAEAGTAREQERAARVARQLRARACSEAGPPRASGREARALPASLEARIRSNRHYVQRGKTHMDENFARR